MFSLEGKNAIVTGAAGGIGRAVAERFVAAGARVVITDIVDAQSVASEIGAGFIRTDVGSSEQVASAFAKAAGMLGKLDIVVNNAGIGDVGHTIQETSEDLLERITRINQWGVFYGLKHAPVVMNDGGSIINTSSLAAEVKMVGSGAYSATKAAVISLTRMAALELGAAGSGSMPFVRPMWRQPSVVVRKAESWTKNLRRWAGWRLPMTFPVFSISSRQMKAVTSLVRHWSSMAAGAAALHPNCWKPCSVRTRLARS
jgi:NAD(P)-dependent dehydrogenase (short-subunit alcohol dehydrogenase family)